MNKLQEQIYNRINGALLTNEQRAKIAAEICLEIAGKSFDAGRDFEYDLNPSPNKEQYLSELSGNTEQLKTNKT